MSDVPPLIAIWFVFWMVAPSAWGSVYGIPSSMMADPPSCMAIRMAGVSNSDKINEWCTGIELSEMEEAKKGFEKSDVSFIASSLVHFEPTINSAAPSSSIYTF